MDNELNKSLKALKHGFTATSITVVIVFFIAFFIYIILGGSDRSVTEKKVCEGITEPSYSEFGSAYECCSDCHALGYDYLKFKLPRPGGLGRSATTEQCYCKTGNQSMKIY